MDKWVSDIYKAVIAKHNEFGLRDDAGMAVFYSPVIYNPKILFVGDNPGGEVGTIHKTAPEISEYIEPRYELARMMRRIFSTPELTALIKQGVVINRVFFQSEDINELKTIGIWKNMEQWCLPYVKRIVEKIDPEILFAESIGTFEAFYKIMGGKNKKPLVRDGRRRLLLYGEIGDKMILGIKHPTGGNQRVSYAKWGEVTEKLSEII